MKVKEMMTTDVECVHPRSTLMQAARLMETAAVGSVPVVEDGRVIGMLTDRDIVVRTVAAGIDPAKPTVGEVMTPGVVRCGVEDDIERAAELMEVNNVHRIVVTDERGRLAGIIALTDLAAAALERSAQGTASIETLVQGELSAVRTYRTALEKFGLGEAAGDLRRIVRDHEDAVRLLSGGLSGRTLEQAAPGLWRAFAEAVETGAKRFGDTAVLKALKSGEELEIWEYHQALDDERVSPALKDVICETLLPRAWSHVSTLERCLQPESSA